MKHYDRAHLNHHGHNPHSTATSNRLTGFILKQTEGGMMDREEHLQWAKTRALEYVELDDLTNAFASMASDLDKHPETKDHLAIKFGFTLLLAGHLSTKEQMRKLIEGFN